METTITARTTLPAHKSHLQQYILALADALGYESTIEYVSQIFLISGTSRSISNALAHAKARCGQRESKEIFSLASGGLESGDTHSFKN